MSSRQEKKFNKIGDLYYDGETETWVADSSKMFYIEFLQLRKEVWVQVEKIINIGDPSTDVVLAGELNVFITSKIEIKTSKLLPEPWEDWIPSYRGGIMIWLKNFSVSIKNANGSETPNDDVEYIGQLDERFKNEGEKITLTTGTDIYASDRGKITYKSGTDYISIKEWTRASQTFCIEKLLLNSIASNYRFGFLKINNLKLRQGFSILNVLTDNTKSDKVFMLKNAKFDYEYNEVECSIWETSPDRLTIVE